MVKKPRIDIPDMCRRHQSILVFQAGVGPDDPWQLLVTAAQIALFQSVTSDMETYEKLDGDMTRISELGCLACYKPEAFVAIVEVAPSQDPSSIMALGEHWMRMSVH